MDGERGVEVGYLYFGGAPWDEADAERFMSGRGGFCMV